MEILHASSQPNGILLLTFTGEVATAADAHDLKIDIDTVSRTIRDLHKSQGKGIKILINITNFTAEHVAEAIDAMVTLAREDKHLVEKTAVFGASKKIRVIGESIILISGRDNIKFFESKADALEWLG